MIDFEYRASGKISISSNTEVEVTISFIVEYSSSINKETVFPEVLYYRLLDRGRAA